MRFHGQTHHPGDLRVGVAQMLQLAFFGGLAVSIAGRGLLPAAASEWLSNNQLLSFGMLFGCNMMAGKLINTGAFEITYDGVAVWSKIGTGRFPSLPELVESVTDVAKLPSKAKGEDDSF
uniref:Selenoprotein T n=1 Tax=Coccolithus braarudii TaxID=221442 RepID=A0A7S0L8Q2_9EUKA|mmetsp:Transcript_24261/g.52346  ORF Transcript_24261/g.52346 Transcript_24261/m.52346 type:complete len:120 (+) Transcript_24261:239-598(+)